MNLNIRIVKIESVEDCNIILGTSHFIKTIEDLYETLTESSPNIEFGISFCESSGPCLVRSEGNDEELKQLATKKAYELSCGHCFLVVIRKAFPINVLNRIKRLSEVCTIHAATANPLEVVILETEQGRGILGVVDGFKSKGIETEQDVKDRRELLRKLRYKL
ncbi:MAG: adenosine-specific kinase [Candidatus Bathyarchaeota archaeon]|nr:MAG: adenosine-specific kinase [Candidatus Bathyarchaeota archaeon]